MAFAKGQSPSGCKKLPGHGKAGEATPPFTSGSLTGKTPNGRAEFGKKSVRDSSAVLDVRGCSRCYPELHSAPASPICFVGAVREPPLSAIARNCGRFSKRPYNSNPNRRRAV